MTQFKTAGYYEHNIPANQAKEANILNYKEKKSKEAYSQGILLGIIIFTGMLMIGIILSSL